MILSPYTSIEIRENNEPMVNIESLGLILEPKYFQQRLSADSRMFLRKEAARKLLKVQSRLAGLRLKIWDVFRSREVQNNIYKKFWSEVKTAHPVWGDKKIQLEVGKYVHRLIKK